MSWVRLAVAPDRSHHTSEDGTAAYAERFDEVLKFHAPGLAPVSRGGKAWHIHADGSAAYPRRFARTFGFYEGLAAVEGEQGWHHITPSGLDAYAQRYAWCGNFQEGLCPVRLPDGTYRRLRQDGSLAPGSWRYAGDLRDGIGVVQGDDGRSTHVDLHGHEVHGVWFLDLDVFHKGFARARDDGGWTHVDRLGRPISRRRFASVEPFYNGQARVERFDGALEVIDEAGACLVLLRPPPGLPVGHEEPSVGGFRLQRDGVLARSAWGVVRLATGPSGETLVAKSTRASHARELEVLTALEACPHVPRVLGRTVLDGSDWLFLGLCRGQPAGQRRRCEPLSVRDAIAVGLVVLEVCAALHSRGWIHTDLHPGNILLQREVAPVQVTVLDFASVLALGASGRWSGEVNWGVWDFAPPEQLDDFSSLDASVDVYAAASLIAYLIRGAPPFSVDVAALAPRGWDAVRAAYRAAKMLPDLSGVPPSTAIILRAALDENPTRRPSTTDLARRLHDEQNRG